jgi:hypothetical protein
LNSMEGVRTSGQVLTSSRVPNKVLFWFCHGVPPKNSLPQTDKRVNGLRVRRSSESAELVVTF